MLETALTTLLQSATGLSDRIASGTTTVLVNTALPRVAYSQIDEQRRYSDAGNTGPTQARFQLDIFADTTAAAKTVAADIKKPFDPQKAIGSGDKSAYSGLDNYRGTAEGIRILRMYFGGTSVQIAEHLPGQQKTIARCIVEVFIEFTE